MKIFAGLLVLVVIGIGVTGHYYENDDFRKYSGWSWGREVSERWTDDRPEIPVFRTLSVMEGDLFVGVAASGTVEPVEVIDVGTQISGRISRFGPDEKSTTGTIDFGSRVNADMIMAVLDDQPAKAALNTANVNVQLAEAELKRAQANLKQAERAFERSEKLQGTISAAEYEKSETDVDIAKADAAIAQAKLDQAIISKDQAEIDLGYTVIRAPIDGIVIDRRVNVGQTVISGLNAPSLFLLARDLSEMQVWAAVNEADIGKIHVGQHVTFSVDSAPKETFTGEVAQIRLNASLHQNVVTYGVIVRVSNPEGKLLPYMTAKIEFDLARRTDAVLIPNHALRWQPRQSHVSPSAMEELKPLLKADSVLGSTVSTGETDEDLKVETESPVLWTIAEDGLLRPIPVTTGLTDGNVTEITGGDIEPGAAVVVAAMKPKRADFVSTFIDPVTQNDE